MICMRAIQFAKEFFPAICWAESVSVLTGWFLLLYSSEIKLLISRRSTRSLSLPFRFFWVNIGLAYLEIGSVVIIPHRCKKANSTRLSFLRFIGVDKFRLYVGESSFDVNFTLNSSFIPKSRRCFAKISWNSTKKSSMRAISCSCIMESVQSKLLTNCCLDSRLSCRLSFSSSWRLSNSIKIRFWIGA